MFLKYNVWTSFLIFFKGFPADPEKLWPSNNRSISQTEEEDEAPDAFGRKMSTCQIVGSDKNNKEKWCLCGFWKKQGHQNTLGQWWSTITPRKRRIILDKAFYSDRFCCFCQCRTASSMLRWTTCLGNPGLKGRVCYAETGLEEGSLCNGCTYGPSIMLWCCLFAVKNYSSDVHFFFFSEG